MTRTALLCFVTLLTMSCSRLPRESPHYLELRPASYENVPGSMAMDNPYNNKPLFVSESILITHKDIQSARRTEEPHTGATALQLTLTKQAGERMYQHTRQHLNKPIAIILNGDLLSAPTVMSALRTDVYYRRSRRPAARSGREDSQRGTRAITPPAALAITTDTTHAVYPARWRAPYRLAHSIPRSTISRASLTSKSLYVCPQHAPKTRPFPHVLVQA